MTMTAEEVLAEIGPVQEILDEHDGVVTVLDTSDGNIMLSLDGGCNGCSSTPMTAMQIYYSLKKLEAINDVIFVNGELPEYMRTFIVKRWPRKPWKTIQPVMRIKDLNLRAKSFDYSSDLSLPIVCGLAPKETFSPLMFIRAEIAITIQTKESGLGK